MYLTSYAITILSVVLALVFKTVSGDSNAEPAFMVQSAVATDVVFPADTVAFEVLAGETLIFALPDSLSGEKVDNWKINSAPAYSKLANRGFLWRTRSLDRGYHVLEFEGMSNIDVDDYIVERIESWTANVHVQ